MIIYVVALSTPAYLWSRVFHEFSFRIIASRSKIEFKYDSREKLNFIRFVEPALQGNTDVAMQNGLTWISLSKMPDNNVRNEVKILFAMHLHSFHSWT